MNNLDTVDFPTKEVVQSLSDTHFQEILISSLTVIKSNLLSEGLPYSFQTSVLTKGLNFKQKETMVSRAKSFFESKGYKFERNRGSCQRDGDWDSIILS